MHGLQLRPKGFGSHRTLYNQYAPVLETADQFSFLQHHCFRCNFFAKSYIMLHKQHLRLIFQQQLLRINSDPDHALSTKSPQ